MGTSRTVWVVGQYQSGEFPNVVWDLSGIFESRELALEACRDKYYFIGPMQLNKQYPHEVVEWPGGEYPLKSHENVESKQ